MNTKPNILWICTDQQRFDTLGCYGNRFVETPNLDALSANGAQFDCAFSQSPVCTPSRASFLTGRYPRTTRTRQNGQDIPDDEVLVTKLLADAGYTCGLAGKLHLSACNPEVCPEMERRIDDGYSDFHWSHHSQGGWGLHNEYHAWLDEKGERFKLEAHPDCKHIHIGMPEELSQSYWCAEKSIDFIKENNGSPWAFSVNMYDPHHPFDAPEEALNRYMDMLDDIPLPDYKEGELDNKPPYQLHDHKGAYGTPGSFYPVSEKEAKYITASYWAMCDVIDRQVGRMLDVLRETGQLDNTIVIFMSDHGEMLGDHGIYLKGPYFYEPAVKVPLIVSWPGKVNNLKTNALVELTDIAPTLLEAAGMDVHAGMQGKSLWPMLSGKAPADHHRDDVYCEYFGAMGWHDTPPYLTMLRTKDYKLVIDHSNNGGELYDLKSDPAETYNKWNDADLAEVKSGLLARAAGRLAFTCDPLPVKRAAW